MPLREGGFSKLEALLPEQRTACPSRAQDHWYLLASRCVKDRSVLDVGAGSGAGMELLSAGLPKTLAGIDPQPMTTGVTAIDVSQVQAAAFDVVVCCDVIEHVEDDVTFLKHLLRVARQACFISTPNWNEWHAQNPYHVREYTPDELQALVGSREFQAWTVGKNRLEQPVHAIQQLNEAQAQFALLLRADECSDEQWKDLCGRLQEQDLGAWINSRLSHLAKWADEWMTELLTVVAGLHYPDSITALQAWLQRQLEQNPKELPLTRSSLNLTDPVDVLRHGVATREQAAHVLGWAITKAMRRPVELRLLMTPGRQPEPVIQDAAGGVWHAARGLLFTLGRLDA